MYFLRGSREPNFREHHSPISHLEHITVSRMLLGRDLVRDGVLLRRRAVVHRLLGTIGGILNWIWGHMTSSAIDLRLTCAFICFRDPRIPAVSA